MFSCISFHSPSFLFIYSSRSLACSLSAAEFSTNIVHKRYSKEIEGGSINLFLKSSYQRVRTNNLKPSFDSDWCSSSQHNFLTQQTRSSRRKVLHPEKDSPEKSMKRIWFHFESTEIFLISRFVCILTFSIFQFARSCMIADQFLTHR